MYGICESGEPVLGGRIVLGWHSTLVSLDVKHRSRAYAAVSSYQDVVTIVWSHRWRQQDNAGLHSHYLSGFV